MIFRYTTESGSVYYLRVTPGQDVGYFAGQNIVSPSSCPIPDREWPVKIPADWDPGSEQNIGRRLYFETVYLREYEHPDRIPGGGKFTSYVTSVEEVNTMGTLPPVPST